jgi:hypothetical protein
MALNIGVSRTFPGFGIPSLQSIQVATGIPVTSGTTYYVPGTPVNTNTTAGLLIPTVTVGRLRIKIYNGLGTTPAVTKIQVKASDGTNSVVIADWNFGTAVSITSTSWLDLMTDFIADTATGSTSGGAVGQLISASSATSGNGGVQYLSIVPTLTGTAPPSGGAVTMDWEVFGLI